MINSYRIQDNRVVENGAESPQALVVIDPTPEEKKELITRYRLD